MLVSRAQRWFLEARVDNRADCVPSRESRFGQEAPGSTGRAHNEQLHEVAFPVAACGLDGPPFGEATRHSSYKRRTMSLLSAAISLFAIVI
jgi:hypothetical protein